MTRLVIALALALCAAPAAAQLPSIPHMDKVLKGAQVLESLTITADEERQIGAMVSERIRRRYEAGDARMPPLHRYVALVARSSRRRAPSRPAPRLLPNAGSSSSSTPTGSIAFARPGRATCT